MNPNVYRPIFSEADEVAARRTAAVLVQLKFDFSSIESKYDTSPVGKPGGKQNWLDKTGGLPLFIRAIAHALMAPRGTHTESSAIQIAIGVCQRWAEGKGNVTPKTRAKAQAALALLKAKGVASRAMSAGRAVAKQVGGSKTWDNSKKVETKTTTTGVEVEIEYKAVSAGTTVVDEDAGIVKTIVSVTGMNDRVKDNILPGAYEKSFKERKPKGVWSHDWNKPISKTLSIAELMPGDPALPKTLRDGSPWPAGVGVVEVETQFNLETQLGKDAFSNVKFYGPDQEWSIGYRVPTGAGKTDTKTGIRSISEIDLFEYSPVLFGAMPQAVTQSVKSENVDAYNTFYMEVTGKSEEIDDMDVKDLEIKRAFTSAERGDLAKTGAALPDGSFPITNGEDLDNAITAMGRSKHPQLVRDHIVKRAKALNLTSKLPEDLSTDSDGNKKALSMADTTPAYLSSTTANSSDLQMVQLSSDSLLLIDTAIQNLKDLFDLLVSGTVVDDDDDFDTGTDPSGLLGGKDDKSKMEYDDSLTTLTKTVDILVESKGDDIPNITGLSEAAAVFDSAFEDGTEEDIKSASEAFLAELKTAMTDTAEDEDTQGWLEDTADDFKSILESMASDEPVKPVEEAKVALDLSEIDMKSLELLDD